MNDIIEEKNEFKKLIKSIHKNNIIFFQAHSSPLPARQRAVPHMLCCQVSQYRQVI